MTNLDELAVCRSLVKVLIFAGFFIKKDDMMKGWQWLTYTSFFRYAFESALIALFGDIGGGPRVLDECSKFNESLTSQSPSNLFPIRKFKIVFGF